MITIQYNPYQVAFLEARRSRLCKDCKQAYQPLEGELQLTECPLCKTKNLIRTYDRLSLVAGRRGGKTLVGALAALEELQRPDSVGWACAPSYPKLHDYVMPAIKCLIPREWVDSGFAAESVEHKEIRFGNGALVQFRSLDDPDTGRGPGLDWLWIDEVCEVAEEAWNNISPALADKAGVAWFTSSPRGFDWVYRRLWVPATTSVPGFWACKYKTSDNPLFQTVQGRSVIEKDRASMSSEKFRQEYEADFVAFEGAIYNVPQQLVLRTDEQVRKLIPEWPAVDPTRRSIVGIDTGTKHPFAAVWLIQTEGGLVVAGEYCEQMRSARQHAASVLEMVGAHMPRFVIERDPQMQIELAQFGLIAQQVEKGPGSVMAGIDRVKAWMEQGRLYFIEARTPRLIAQLQSYRMDKPVRKDGMLLPERPFKLEDDLADALRYAVQSWPSLPKPVETSKPLGRDLAKDPLPSGQEWTFERMKRMQAREDLKPVEEYPVSEIGYVGRSDQDEGYEGLGGLWGG